MKRDTVLEKKLIEDFSMMNIPYDVWKESASLGMALGSDLADWEEWREKNAKEMFEEFRASLDIEALLGALIDSRFNDARAMALDFVSNKAFQVVEENKDSYFCESEQV